MIEEVNMIKRVVILFIFIFAISLSMMSVAQIDEISLYLLSTGIFSIPGFLIVRTLIKPNKDNWMEYLFFSIVIGISISSFLAICIGYWIQWNEKAVIIAILALSLILLFVTIKVPVGRIVFPSWEKSDYIILMIINAAVILSLLIPYHNVGRLTDHGYGYAALFGHDFIIRASYCASIAHSIPPENFHLSGSLLPTYWIYYVLPSLVYRASAFKFDLMNLLLIAHIYSAVVFTSLFFILIRTFFKNKKTLILTLLMAFCAYSYLDLYVFINYLVQYLPGNIADILREKMPKFSGLSHSFFRVVLFEPHVAMNLCVLSILILITPNREGEKKPFPERLMIGILMGIAMGIDAFTGMIISLWCGVFLTYKFLFKDRTLIGFFRNLLFPAAVSLIIFVVFIMIQMYSLSGNSGSLLIKVYKMIVLLFPIYFILEYGPVIIFGFSGIYIALKKMQIEKSEVVKILLLILIPLAFTLFVRHHIEINLGLRKGGYVLYLPLLIFAGIYIDYLITHSKKIWRYIFAFLICLAIPSLFTDIYLSANIWNSQTTTYLNTADKQACDWIKSNTPLNSIVQSDPDYPGPYEYSLIVDFAERPMVIGESKNALFVPWPNIEIVARERKKDVTDLYKSTDLLLVKKILIKYNIGYVYVGSREKALYAEGVKKFDSATELFEKVYDKMGVSIYKII